MKLSQPSDLIVLFRDVFIGMILVVVIPTTFLGVVASGNLNVINLVGALFIMAVLQFLPNALNNYADWEIDAINGKRKGMHKIMNKKDLLIISFVLFLITVPFFILGNLYLKITMIIAYFFIINYNMFIRAKDIIFLNYAFIAFFYGALAFAVGFFFASSSLSSFVHLIWIPIFLFFVDMGFSVSKDYEDIEGDARMGKITIPNKFGKRISLLYQVTLISIVFIAIIYFAIITLNKIFFIGLAVFYLIALYSLRMVHLTEDKERHHKAHNIIRTNALLIRSTLIILFLLGILV